MEYCFYILENGSQFNFASNKRKWDDLGASVLGNTSHNIHEARCK